MELGSISTISDLPSPEKLEKRCKALALLDAALSPDWENRYFSFNSGWDKVLGERMASMRNGSGDHYFIHFSEAGVAGKVFCHEFPPAPSVCFDRVPISFKQFKNEVAFSHSERSLYFWREVGQEVWSISPDKLIEVPLLGYVAQEWAYYVAWAEEHYERSIPSDAVAEVWNYLKLTPGLLERLNYKVSLDDLSNDLADILG